MTGGLAGDAEDRHRRRGDGNVAMEAEAGVTWPQA